LHSSHCRKSSLFSSCCLLPIYFLLGCEHKIVDSDTTQYWCKQRFGIATLSRQTYDLVFLLLSIQNKDLLVQWIYIRAESFIFNEKWVKGVHRTNEGPKFQSHKITQGTFWSSFGSKILKIGNKLRLIAQLWGIFPNIWLVENFQFFQISVVHDPK